MHLPVRSVDGLGPRRQALWRRVRGFIPARFRFFYEGCPGIPGQLWHEERRLLYHVIRERRPRRCFEIGTWQGGGSTYFTARALADNGAGLLHTIEIAPEFHRTAVDRYRRHAPDLLPYVRFHLGDYRRLYPALLAEDPVVDMVILDGPEDADINEQQFLYFLPWLKKGAMLFQHDWYTEKARKVREHLERSPDWQIATVLSPPYSLGFALAVRK